MSGNTVSNAGAGGDALRMFMHPIQASQIFAETEHHLYYDDLVGHNAYSRPWDDDRAWMPPMLEDKAVARAGMHEFLTVAVQNLEKVTGETLLSADDDLEDLRNIRLVIYEIFRNEDRSGRKMRLESGGEIVRIPSLHYQRDRTEPSQAFVEDPAERSRADFLYFASSLPAVKPPDAFESDIRFYLTPKIDHTPQAAAFICRSFADELGYLPEGKFVEDATSAWTEQRNDRLIFWASAPEELTVLVRAAKQLQTISPHIFSWQTPILLGSRVYAGNTKINTGRIAQEPSEAMHEMHGEQVSFNESRIGILQRAGQEVRENKDDTTLTDDMRLLKFINVVKKLSQEQLIHPENFAFNASQDLAVVEDALAQA